MLRNFSSLDSPLDGNNNREEGEEESFWLKRCAIYILHTVIHYFI
jgi:hypothetical protein